MNTDQNFSSSDLRSSAAGFLQRLLELVAGIRKNSTVSMMLSPAATLLTRSGSSGSFISNP
jgi:hypothetical protein